MRGFFRRRFVRFLLVGALNTAFSYALFAVFILIGITYPIAALLATVIGVLFNFKSYGTLVFGDRGGSGILRFFAVYAVVYATGVGLLRIADANHVPVLLAAAVLAPPMAVFSFTLNRLFVFHRPQVIHSSPPRARDPLPTDGPVTPGGLNERPRAGDPSQPGAFGPML